MMIRRGHEEIVEGHPGLHDVISVEGGAFGGIGEFRDYVKILRGRKFDTGIVLWSTAPVAWLMFLSGIPVRVGQGSRLLYSFLYTHRVAVRSERGDENSHWVECLLDYIRILGCEIRSPELMISVRDEVLHRTDALLEGVKRPLIGLHVGKGIPLSPRRWPVQFFAKLADEISARFNATVVLTGDLREKELVGAVASLMERRPLNCAGKTSLKELAALISRCDAFVCPDSAPMHIAAAMKVPTVGIFALKSDFPGRWGPYGTTYEIVRPHPINCPKTCVKEKCPYFECYEQVSIEEVIGAVEKVKTAP